MTNQWDTYADLYDKGIGSQGDTLHTKLIDPLIFQFLGDKKYDSILDAGCGNGYLLRKFADQARSLVGIDASKKLLAAATHNTSGLPNVSTVLGDLGQNLPFDSLSFDVVIANMTLQYLPALEQFALESARVLKKHGILIVVIDHPAHALFLRAQELVGKKNSKFLTSASYFLSGKRSKKSLWDKAILEYYHRPMESYINPFTKFLQLDRMIELSQDSESPRILGLRWKKV
ncbi:MAG: class I SAM-dependent methyltransferase [Patescibacteria group bacterium]